MLLKYLAIKNAITSIVASAIIYSCLVETNLTVKAIATMMFAIGFMGIMCEADKLYLHMVAHSKNKKSASVGKP